MTAFDGSTYCDSLTHKTLISKVQDRTLPLCFINVIYNWYSKLR